MTIEHKIVEDAIGDWKEQVVITNDDGSQVAWTKVAWDAQQEAQREQSGTL